MDKKGEIKRNLLNPPIKDTVIVPDGGFTIIRFLANNPGYWLMHCHMSWHNHLGMGFVIKVRRKGRIAAFSWLFSSCKCVYRLEMFQRMLKKCQKGFQHVATSHHKSDREKQIQIYKPRLK